MNEGFTEPRTAIWALAEVCWIDAAGHPLRAAATLEDTSASGACIRVKTPISVGSNLTIKWHREQFSGVARNCRTDGRDFLLGIQRNAAPATRPDAVSPASAPVDAKPKLEQPESISPSPAVPTDSVTIAAPESVIPAPPEPVPALAMAAALGTIRPTADIPPDQSIEIEIGIENKTGTPVDSPVPRKPVASVSLRGKIPHHRERNTMESKGLLPKFWRRQGESAGQQEQAPLPESTSSNLQSPADSVGRASELLSYEDIYHAAGILSPRSGYGIHKVLEMINSDRIRDLAPEIKRASVLMAIEAAGASADDVLQDAMRRQHALDTYEAGQQKQIEEFESRKTKENAQIQAEMERVTARYAERVQRNQDQVAQEKEALRNWQMAKQHESQRIAEVMSLCMREPAPVTESAPAAAAARAGAGSSRATPLGPSLLPDAHKKPD